SPALRRWHGRADRTVASAVAGQPEIDEVAVTRIDSAFTTAVHTVAPTLVGQQRRGIDLAVHVPRPLMWCRGIVARIHDQDCRRTLDIELVLRIGGFRRPVHTTDADLPSDAAPHMRCGSGVLSPQLGVFLCGTDI